MLQNFYDECKSYVEFLSPQKVEKFIIPKALGKDGEGGGENIISNLQSAPFENESSFMDLVKDGQISQTQMKQYLKVKTAYRQYVNVRIIFYDIPELYNDLQLKLLDLLGKEIKGK